MIHPNAPKLNDWNYRHHNGTPIAKAAERRSHRWFNRGQRVVVDNARVGYLNGLTGEVVALQTSAIVVLLDEGDARRYGDKQGIVRFDGDAITVTN